MRIIGLGVDLADIDRVESLYARYPRFIQRCFTDHEQEYALRFAKPARRLAARFAGKEAVMKSMGTGWRRLRWTDIEITGGGAPRVRLAGTAAERAETLGVSDVLVTITHTDTSALVMAVAVGEHDTAAVGEHDTAAVGEVDTVAVGEHDTVAVGEVDMAGRHEAAGDEGHS